MSEWAVLIKKNEGPKHEARSAAVGLKWKAFSGSSPEPVAGSTGPIIY